MKGMIPTLNVLSETLVSSRRPKIDTFKTSKQTKQNKNKQTNKRTQKQKKTKQHKTLLNFIWNTLIINTANNTDV